MEFPSTSPRAFMKWSLKKGITFTFLPTLKMKQAGMVVMNYTCIWAESSSNSLCAIIGYPGRYFWWFSSVSRGECMDRTLK
jgi:hypothetical protein